MNIISCFEMEIDMKLLYELLACQSYFYISAHFWLDKQEKNTFNRGLLLNASLSICCHLMQWSFWKLKIGLRSVLFSSYGYWAPWQKNLQSFFSIIYHAKKDILMPKVKEPQVKFRQRCEFVSGVKTCKCFRQRMIHLLCTEKLAINFRFRSQSILLGKN